MSVATAQQYKTAVHPVWCPGCGDFGVLTAIYNALAKLVLDPKKVVMIAGIGCSGRLAGYVKSYGFHVVHGRTLPTAMGVKLANPDLEVLAVGGDGDGFGIGGGHIPHIARRNVDICYLVMDNQTYGLTKGQYSPTSPQGLKTGSSPYGNVDEPINPIALTIAYNASFVARGYSGRPQELVDLIVQAITHKGFAFIDVISPCVTFYNTYKEIPPRIALIPPDHNPSDRVAAFRLANDADKTYLGVFYKTDRPSFEERVMGSVKKAEEAGRTELQRILSTFA